MSERFYIHCADNLNKQLIDTESDFNIHIEEISNEELLIQLCNLLNKLSEENEQLKEEKEYFERKKEYFLSEWSIAHAKNIQLRQEIKELKKVKEMNIENLIDDEMI